MGMSIEPDPYRILGLSRGASPEEIRRAYRRLVKENHPDSAGEKALPRFLAIQAAYEALEAGPSRRAGDRPSASRPTPREPWRADPDRAGAAHDGSRRTGRPAYGAGSGAAAAGRGSADTTGTTGAGAAGGSRSRARPTGGADGVGASQRGPGERTRRENRKRAPNKATLGSTSYDAADDEPFEPEWSGGTWYGASSGTYWTINPKEYADPRKHGPEYQRRARRGTARRGATSSKVPDPSWDGDPEEPFEPPVDNQDDGESPAATEAPIGPAAGRPRRAPGPAGSTSAWSTSTGSSSSWDAAGAAGASADRPDGLDPFAAAASVAMSLAGTPRGFMARVALALIGWPAIGLALTTAVGEITGCGRFAASCVDLFGVGTWLAQLVIIAILLALPSVAALSAVGSLVALAASVPTAVILSASGGSHEPAASAAILGVVLVVAYTAGVLVALVRRRRLAPLP
jgi:curved DNA-binding protein CbpA